MADLNLTLNVTNTYQLTVSYVNQLNQSQSPGGTVTYKSDAPNIASVNTTGLITANAAGFAYITATNGTAVGYARVSVTATESAIKLELT